MIKQSKLKKSRRLQRQRRHFRVRNKIKGTAARPRLVVFRSLKNIEGQLVDDDAAVTLVGMSTLAPGLRDFKAEGQTRRAEHAFAAGKPRAEQPKRGGSGAGGEEVPEGGLLAGAP